MPFSQEVKIKAMVACGRCCAICHKFCGNNMEVHHIKAQAEGGSDEYENAIPLCFDCHAEVRQYDPKHPKGIRFTEQELRQHRDNWYKKVEVSGAVCETLEFLEMDRKTYYFLEKYLPRDRLITLRDIEFDGGCFRLGYFDEVEYFPRLINDPAYEYLDADLESHKVRMATAISSFTRLSIPYLFSDDGKFVRIPPDWADVNPSVFNEGVHVLNAASTEVWNAYVNYIKLCRRKLQIEVR